MPCTSSLCGEVLQTPPVMAEGKGMNGLSKQINNLIGQVLQQPLGASAHQNGFQPTSGACSQPNPTKQASYPLNKSSVQCVVFS